MFRIFRNRRTNRMVLLFFIAFMATAIIRFLVSYRSNPLLFLIAMPLLVPIGLFMAEFTVALISFAMRRVRERQNEFSTTD